MTQQRPRRPRRRRSPLRLQAQRRNRSDHKVLWCVLGVGGVLALGVSLALALVPVLFRLGESKWKRLPGTIRGSPWTRRMELDVTGSREGKQPARNRGGRGVG
jgi:hypothetical protein